MNYNYGTTQGTPPNLQQGMIFDSRYGFIDPVNLQKKQVRQTVNRGTMATFAMLAASVIIGGIIGAMLIFTGVNMDPEAFPLSSGIPTQVYFALQVMLVPLTTGLPFFVYMLISKFPAEKAIMIQKVKLGRAFLLMFAGAGLCLVANFPAQILGGIIDSVGLDPGYTELPEVKDVFSGVLYFVGIAVMPPIFEEFAFRGVLLGSLRKHGDFFAIMVSSIIFGAVHMSVTSIPFAIMAGMVMGYIYVVTGNIWINIGVHFLNNALSVTMDIIGSNTPEMVGNIITVLMFYGFIVIGLVCLIVLLVRKELPHKLYKPSSMMLTSGQKVLCAVTNPGFIIVISICLLSAVSGMFV